MKCLAIMLLTFLSASLWASDGRILQCLGEEEKRLHLKKDTGPIYDLNQRLIAEIVQIPNIQIASEDFRNICSKKNFSESWKLLELSIKKGKALFVLPKELSGIQRSMTEGMIDDYVVSTREILISFISQVQTLSPTPTCLKEEIPELDNFFVEIKYLEGDVDMKTIFAGKDQKIFEKLKDYPRAFEKCRARLKKKPRSGSTAEAKKS